MNKKIMLIDGNSIINRAFYALPLLTNKEGDFTNAVYGFLNIFFKLYDEERPEYLAVTFDLPKPTFRHLQYAEYKGNRKSMPEELRPQLGTLKNLLTKMNIKIFEMEGYEADDILGTLATSAEKIGLDVVVISGDRDLLQLSTKTIKIRIPKTKAGKTEVEDYYEQDVLEKIGVTPKEYIDVKALMGDASDNIPGVPGIGEKTAVKIIQEYKTIEAAIENATEVKPKKASENLVTYKEQAIMSKELATIVVDVPVAFQLEETMGDQLYNFQSLEEIKRLEFKTLIPRFLSNALDGQELNHDENIQSEQNKMDFREIISLEQAKEFIGALMLEKLVAFNLVFVDNENIGISFSANEQSATFIKMSDEMDENSILGICKSFFESDVKKITLDSKRELVYLQRLGYTVNHICFDLMLAAYIIDSSQDSYFYDDIAVKFLDENYATTDMVLGKGKSKIKWDNIEATELLQYACRMSHVAFRAYPVMNKMLEENKQTELYYNVEFPLAAVLQHMEVWGIKVNKDELIVYGDSLNKLLNTLTEEIYELAGESFNINSPMQLGVILFEKLGLKGTKKTKQGYSTAADVLEKLADKHPIIQRILEYRTYAKLKSTYVEGLLSVIDEETGKIYSTFNQTIASTGRISSVEPNLQNIPIRLELGRRLRKAFVPTDDHYVFLDGDYSQIELRVLAHMADDETLIRAFKEGQDIHRLTASQVFNTPLDEVTSRQRSNAKAVNFGIIYGIGSFSLSQDLGITKKEADQYIAGYFEKYPKVRKYMDDTISAAKEDGYASTIFNRRRFIPELNSSNFNQRSFGERVAMNMPVQGSAADIIKIAMIKTHNRLLEGNFKSRLILQVHDELLLEAHKDELATVKEILKEEMEHAVTLKVPLETDFHEGETWYDAK